uniref:Uncharacterized protein n=1 Tax=Arundo donax TaxID=35708 RepID=A0A0A9DW71_ARUDO
MMMISTSMGAWQCYPCLGKVVLKWHLIQWLRPAHWSRVFLHNMANIAKEARTVRRVLDLSIATTIGLLKMGLPFLFYKKCRN